MLWKLLSCSLPLRSKKNGESGKNMHLQAQWMPSSTWMFVVLTDVSLSLWHLLRLSNLFPVLHVCSDPFAKELAKGQWALSSPQIHGMGTPLFLSLFSLWYFSVSSLFSLLCFPVSPCLSFQRPECVAASNKQQQGDKKEGEGVLQGRRGVGKGAVGYTVWGGMGMRALTTCGAPKCKAILTKQGPKHCSWAEDCIHKVSVISQQSKGKIWQQLRKLEKCTWNKNLRMVGN